MKDGGQGHAGVDTIVGKSGAGLGFVESDTRGCWRLDLGSQVNQ